MNYSIGTVIEIKILNTSKTMAIELQDGRIELFFSDLKGFNKSLKVGDSCKVYFKHSILAGYISYKATKIKGEV